MLLTVHAQPNAKRTEIVAWLDEDTVKIKIAAPATEGRANDELVRFLAHHFGVPRSRVQIVRGLTTRMKQIVIAK